MKAFSYASPQSIDETLKLLGQTGSDNRALAGGTDLLTLMKANIAAPDQLIDIKRLSGLPRGIEQSGGAIALGALTTLSEIETSELLAERYPLLGQAAAQAATPQLRNMATLGGNLLQRPRCWYFRHPQLACWLKGGDSCPARDGQNSLHALFGQDNCCAVHPSDLAAALLALDADVQLCSPNGVRTLPLAEFYALPQPERRQETLIENDELLLAVILPAPPDGARSIYLKAMDRKIWSFALAGVAAVVALEQHRITHARLVLSGVAPVPWQVSAAEQVLLDHDISSSLFEQAAATALSGAQALQQNGYKKPLLHQLIQRALSTLTEV
jgi:xanthine dehydrogenase YagS FAD-binding subunit